MEHNKMYNRLRDLQVDPTPHAWARIEGNLKRKKRNDSIFLKIAVAASFLAILSITSFLPILSITFFQINASNSYKIEFADKKGQTENFEFYNIAYSNELSKAYSGNVN